MQAAADNEQSDFNAGIATLMRIDAVKKALNMANVYNDYELQFCCLKALYKELISIMNDEDDAFHKKRFLEVRRNYHQLLHYKRQNKKIIPNAIVDSFDDWETELRNIDQKYGLNMPKKQDPRWAMAGRSRR